MLILKNNILKCHLLICKNQLIKIKQYKSIDPPIKRINVNLIIDNKFCSIKNDSDHQIKQLKQDN